MATANLVSPAPITSERGPFVNEAFIDFSNAENRRAMEAALADVGPSQFCRAVSPKTEVAPSGHVVPRRVERKHGCRLLYPR